MRLFEWMTLTKDTVQLVRTALQQLARDPRFRSADDLKNAVKLAKNVHFAKRTVPFFCLAEHGLTPCPLCVLVGPPSPNPNPHVALRVRDFRQPDPGTTTLIVPAHEPIARLAQLVGVDKLCLDGHGRFGVRGPLQEAYDEMLRNTRREHGPYRN